MDISIPDRIRTLESYDPVTRKRGHAYIPVSLFEFEYLDFPLTLQLQLDREKVLTEGKEVTRGLLIELQVRKGTAGGKPFPGRRDQGTSSEEAAGWCLARRPVHFY